MSCSYQMRGGIRKNENCGKKISKSCSENLYCCSHAKKEKVVKQTEQGLASARQPKSKNNIDGLNFKDLSKGYLESNSEGDEEVGEEEQQYRQQYNFNQNQNQNQNQSESDLNVLESDDESVDIQGLLSQLKKLSTSCPHAPTKNGIKDCIVYLQSF